MRRAARDRGGHVPHASLHFLQGDGCPEDLLSPGALLPRGPQPSSRGKPRSALRKSFKRATTLPASGGVWLRLSRDPSPSKTPAGRRGGHGNAPEMPPSASAPKMSRASRRDHAPRGRVRGGHRSHGAWHSNLSDAGKLLEGGGGFPPQRPRCLWLAFSGGGHQPTAEDGHQPRRVRAGDVPYSFIRLLAEPLPQTVPVKGEGAAPRSPSSGSRRRPSQPWSASRPLPRQPWGELKSPPAWKKAGRENILEVSGSWRLRWAVARAGTSANRSSTAVGASSLRPALATACPGGLGDAELPCDKGPFPAAAGRRGPKPHLTPKQPCLSPESGASPSMALRCGSPAPLPGSSLRREGLRPHGEELARVAAGPEGEGLGHPAPRTEPRVCGRVLGLWSQP